MSKLFERLKLVGKFILGVFTRRLWLKLISFLLALILWTYIISTNTSLTRTKQLEEIPVSSGSKAELSGRTLALATDIQAEYTDAIDVTVEVPQSQYALLERDNITLTPDFSGINAAGIYEVPLRGNTTYGSITSIDPSTVRVAIENLESRNFSLGLEILNADDENYWYDIDAASNSLNPRVVTVSGPESLVTNVSRAVVQVDVGGRTVNPRRGFPVLLEDVNDSVLPTQLLTLTTSASYVSLGIYPKKTLDVAVDESELLKRIPEGYEIVSVTIQPESIIVAAESKTLEAYDNLSIRLEDVQDVSGSHSYSVIMPSNFRYKSAAEVTMTVTTRPIEDGADGE